MNPRATTSRLSCRLQRRSVRFLVAAHAAPHPVVAAAAAWFSGRGTEGGDRSLRHMKSSASVDCSGRRVAKSSGTRDARSFESVKEWRRRRPAWYRIRRWRCGPGCGSRRTECSHGRHYEFSRAPAECTHARARARARARERCPERLRILPINADHLWPPHALTISPFEC
jgi:hypothetical protein